MRINPDDLRRHYASLPDGALLAIDRNELTELARSIYDQEMARRDLLPGEDYGEDSGQDSGSDAEAPIAFQGGREPRHVAELDPGPEPDWLPDAACACTFTVRNPNSTDAAADASAALRAARIPCHVTITEEEPPKAEVATWYSVRLMVPLGLALHAMSVLDHDIFNEEQENEWRGSFEMLSDEDLQAIDPDVLCAGLLDRIARLQRIYADEMSRRGLAPRRQPAIRS